MRLDRNITLESYQARHRWVAGIALLLVFAIPQIANAQQSKKKIPVDITVTDPVIDALGNKLLNFTQGLSNEEQRAMGLLLLRAANAPADNPAGTDVKVSFFSLPRDNPRLNGLDQQAIVVLAKPTERSAPAGTPGGRPPYPVNPLRAALGDGNNVYIGPKHEDPMPAPETINALETKLRDFGSQLSLPERGIMDWLLQRATLGTPGPENRSGTQEVREAARVSGPPIGGPGGLPPLGRALGADPNNPNRAGRWVLRF